MSRNLAVVETNEDIDNAVKRLSTPYVILVKDIEKVIYHRPQADAILLIDDWNNFRDKLPVIQKDVSWINGRRCLVKKTEDGVAICYLDENNSELFHDGVTEAKLDGSMGQWMVDLPEFYIECYEGGSDWVKLYMYKEDYGYGKVSRRTLVGATKNTVKNEQLWSRKYDSDTNEQVQYEELTLENILKYRDNLGEGFKLFDYESFCKVAYMFMAKYKNRIPYLLEEFGSNITNWNDTNKVAGETSDLGNHDGVRTNEEFENIHYSVLGIEDYIGKYHELLGGIHFYEEILDEDSFYKIYIYDGLELEFIPKIDYRMLEYMNFLYVTSTPSGVYINSNSGYANRFEWGEYSDLIPVSFNGSYGLFYGDKVTSGCGGLFSEPIYGNFILQNKNYYIENNVPSIFALNTIVFNEETTAYSRIQYRGKITVIDDPQEFIDLPLGF